MSKRSADRAEDGHQAYLKRRKISSYPSSSVAETNPTDQVQSARQLQQILAFDQDAGRSKRGIQTFKLFLDSFPSSPSENAKRFSILKDYLELQKPADEEDKNDIYLGDIMQTWALAAQSNNESLLSAVPAVLALLLKTISNFLEFSDYGLRLGRTLLQKTQQDLVAKGLSANKSREFLISPALRLLREVAIFDGGAFAKQIFRGRDQTFKSLARNLLIRLSTDTVEDRRKPSVRTNALRFILALIKFLPVDAKRELLNQRDIVSALTRDLKDDPPFIVLEILDTLRAYVLKDESLPRDAKTKILNALSLGRISTLYRYDQINEDLETGKKSVEETAHEFLVLACTSPNLGVLNRQSGFYPRGIDPKDGHDTDAAQGFIDLGLSSIEWMDRFTEKVPVRNTILSDVIQNLKPWSSTKQSELLLDILKAAPELVADYFFQKKSFAFDPKLTTTWVGYSAFLFSTIQLPIPPYFGHQEGYARLPPPTSIVLESILPQPLNQKALTRCLNQQHKLISFFAIRLLVIAFTKLQKVLRMYWEAANQSSSVWNQAADNLTAEFCLRCPCIEDIIKTFRGLEDTELMQREAITKLLVLYYEVVPGIAFDAKFDVSSSLTKTLQAVEEATLSPEDRVIRSMELENLFQFAHFSPGMRWFTKVGGLSMSPFTAMLKLCAEAQPELPLPKLKSVLESVSQQNQLFQIQTSISALDTFILSLRALHGAPQAGAVYEFLDNCISRCATTPIKYIFTLEQIQAEVYDGLDENGGPVSLLTFAILEQWPFVVKSMPNMTLQEIAGFASKYLAASTKIGEDKKVLESVTIRLAADVPDNSATRKTIEHSRKLVGAISVPEPKATATAQAEKVAKGGQALEVEKDNITATMLGEPEKPEDHSALVRWTNKEAEEVLDGGHAAALIMLLSSNHLSVRKEAATNISKLAAKVKESTYEEKEQIWLLLCEVVETAKKVIDQEPLITVISSFASHAVAVLGDPLHCLYPKINTFLSKGPIWDLDKIPLMYKILDEAPTLDDAHYTEIEWLLKYMLAGLRTGADMFIFMKRKVFEKLFSLYSNAFLRPGLQEKILKILFRATIIEGGSTTLITRFSSMTWLEAQVALSGGTPLKVLLDRISESCDKRKVKSWKGAASTQADSTLPL